jgi:acetylglutamate synthase
MSTIPYDKNQFVRAQRNGVLMPQVVVNDSFKFLTMNLHHEKKNASKPRTFKVGKKGTPSKTHKGDQNFTTKRGDKDFHRRGKDVKKSRRPY